MEKKVTRVFEKKSNVLATVGALVVMSVFFNQKLITPVSETNGQQRGIASVGPTALSKEAYAARIEWEKALADQIDRRPSSLADLGEKPSLKDELLIGIFGGIYSVEFQEGRVRSLNFNLAGRGEPVKVIRRLEMIRDFRGVWAVDFAQAELLSSENSKEIFQLYSHNRNPVGKAELDLDQEGRLKSLKFSK